MQVKRCLRDINLRDVRALFRDVHTVLEQLQVPDGMHHVAWKVLASDLKVQTDAVLRKLARMTEDAAAVRSQSLSCIACVLAR